MNLADIIALAKQGYKPSDIKELVALEAEASNAGQPEVSPQPGEETSNDEQIEANPQPEELHYKELYEKQQKEIEQIREELKTAQAANVNRNIADENEKNVEELLADAFREYM
mgnify:CR=1 FL=1